MKKLIKNGFTLVEMAIVMFVMALMLGTGMTILSTQQDQRKIEDNGTKLDEAREALIGFAIAHGRLPCTAYFTSNISNSNGLESFCTNATGLCGTQLTTYQTHGRCSNPYDGLIPAASLGLSDVDSLGFALDPWGNRIHYAVTDANNNAFTKSGGMSSIGISNLIPDLQVCSTATGMTGSSPATNCATGTSLASNDVPAVIYSIGPNDQPGGTGGAGADEVANLNSDRTFITHQLTTANEAGGEFDDQVLWLSQYTLFNRMVQAGKLP
ncbi:MAG: type II secretion system protein [Gallionella sp.]|nr:type II secretion system protein [Gallionella sp.]MDP1940254.1 type II secretion system protein [Gallionella sp.]